MCQRDASRLLSGVTRLEQIKTASLKLESSELIVSNKPVANMLMVAVPPVRNNMSIDALSSAKFSMVTWTLDLDRFRNMKV